MGYNDNTSSGVIVNGVPVAEFDAYKADNTTALGLKVDKVTGKGLSTNDYSNTEKAKVAEVDNKTDLTYVQDALNLKRNTATPIALEDCSAELLGAIAGTTTVDVLSMPQDGSVTPIKLGSGVPKYVTGGKNKLNKATIVNGLVTEAGEINTNSAFSRSDYIPVIASTSYAVSQTMYVAYFNSSKGFILTNTTQYSTFETPVGCAYVIIYKDKASLNVDTLQMELGTISSPYEAYYLKIEDSNDNIPVINSPISNSIIPSMLGVGVPKYNIGKNKLNKATIVDGLVTTEGVISTSALFSRSDYIPVDAETEYAVSQTMYVAYFNSSKGFILTNETQYSTFETPVNTTYVILYKSKADLNADTLQMELGTTSTTYESHCIVLESENNGIPVIPYAKPYNDKACMTVGDSITYRNQWQPYMNVICGFNSVTIHATEGIPIRSFLDGLVVGDLANIDVVTVMAGANDFAGSWPLGTISDAKTVLESFYANCKNVIETLLGWKPSLELVIITTPFIDDLAYGMHTNLAGHTVKDYTDALLEVAKLYNLYTIDLQTTCGYNALNYAYFAPDGVHPSPTVGMPKTGKRIGNQLNLLS